MLWGRKCGIKLHVETGEKMDSWKGQQLFQNFCPGQMGEAGDWESIR